MSMKDHSLHQSVLALETALSHCSVALWHKGSVIAAEKVTERNQQTHRLVPMIASVMGRAGLSFAALGSIATTLGPGSFSGIRIGLATARGLALASKKPVIACSSLELLAWQAYAAMPGHSGPVTVAINAYRQQVYAQNFQYDSATGMIALSEAAAIDRSAVSAHFPTDSFLLAGDMQAELAAEAVSGQCISVAEAQSPDAAALAAYVALHAITPTPRHDLKPLYLRAPDAKPQSSLLESHAVS